MGVTLLVMTDGRGEYLQRSAATFHNLAGITDRVIHDDSGDAEYAAWLRSEFAGFEVVSTAGRSGFAGAYRSAWSWLRGHNRNPWVFSTEDDFTFDRPVDIAAMIGVMGARPLAQLALRRQPWNDAERAAGGIVEQHPDDYAEWADGGSAWLEHRRFFTTNPHLTRADFIATHEWPEGDQSEGRFGVDLFGSEPETRCGFWGSRDSGVWVTHIGAERAGTGY
jgi:hypothetical protein